MFFKRLSGLVEGFAESAMESAEGTLRPELKGIKALASAFCVLVMADKVAEQDEMEAVSSFLVDMDIVIEKALIREVATLFMAQVNRLEAAQKKGIVEFNIELGEILRDVAAVKDDPEWADVIADTVTLVTSGGSEDADEIKARTRILKALGK